ncbi:MAG: nitroreductase family protein [Desulfobacterota bacterium]|jgi:nitroreductase/NAD-dependent dihydropyrimidine dehydrogenase PreA subunit|nr:nitroreductase family protein [Thermodesulfobacteriota bacterium]
MALFTVDPKKCQRDGVCAAECPAGLIELEGEEAFPVPIPGAEELCIHCGHCVAVCPRGALSLVDLKPEDCPPVRKELCLGPDHCEQFLRSRRSIRCYKEKPVSREILTRLIEIARYAPSGHNLQPAHWRIIEKAPEVKRLAGLVADWMRWMIREKPEVAGPLHFDRVAAAWEQGTDRICRGAPHLIVAHAPRNLPPAQAACTIALTYLDLAAPAFGLGTCWAGYFTAAATLYAPLAETLCLPPDHQAYGALMIGYPKFSYHRLPRRKEPPITWG